MHAQVLTVEQPLIQQQQSKQPPYQSMKDMNFVGTYENGRLGILAEETDIEEGEEMPVDENGDDEENEEDGDDDGDGGGGG